VTEAYFNANYTKNPVNLIRVCNVCDSAQPRFKLNPDHVKATPPFKYLAYQQCLPGCIVLKNNQSDKTTMMTSNKQKNFPLTNDILCKAYDGAKGKNHPQKLESLSFEAPVGNSSDQGKKSRVWFLLDPYQSG
jgi:hypothetical protein